MKDFVLTYIEKGITKTQTIPAMCIGEARKIANLLRPSCNNYKVTPPQV